MPFSQSTTGRSCLTLGINTLIKQWRCSSCHWWDRWCTERISNLYRIANCWCNNLSTVTTFGVDKQTFLSSEWRGEDAGCVNILGEDTGAEICRLLVTCGDVAVVVTAEVWVTWARANVQVAWAPVGVGNPLKNLSSPSSSPSQGRVSKSSLSEGVCVLLVSSQTFSFVKFKFSQEFKFLQLLLLMYLCQFQFPFLLSEGYLDL